MSEEQAEVVELTTDELAQVGGGWNGIPVGVVFA